MKKHITFKQLNQLSEKGKEKLRKWWNDEKREWGQWYVEGISREKHYMGEIDGRGGEISPYMPMFQDDLPLLSIGQCIEFLDEKWPLDLRIHRTIKKMGHQFSMARYWWYVLPKGKKGYFFQKELCDALWEAVKEVLEK